MRIPRGGTREDEARLRLEIKRAYRRCKEAVCHFCDTLDSAASAARSLGGIPHSERRGDPYRFRIQWRRHPGIRAPHDGVCFDGIPVAERSGVAGRRRFGLLVGCFSPVGKLDGAGETARRWIETRDRKWRS